MKRFWTFFLLLCSTAVFLIACSDNQTAEAMVPTEAPEVAATTAPTIAPSVIEDTDSGNSGLALIGQTGNPQFLNAYASW
ncbi:hypothetical protein [Candidatus Leptofilum sp.]|uniref:hypothetical protein n=1 Tax=Candidatus Leptofilum sp. TaxID=3241576 RepID=UPI003B5ADB8B